MVDNDAKLVRALLTRSRHMRRSGMDADTTERALSLAHLAEAHRRIAARSQSGISRLGVKGNATGRPAPINVGETIESPLSRTERGINNPTA